MNEIIKAGDTIKCHDIDDMAEVMATLKENDIEVDVVYERNGEKGYFLMVNKVGGKQNE